MRRWRRPLSGLTLFAGLAVGGMLAREAATARDARDAALRGVLADGATRVPVWIFFTEAAVADDAAPALSDAALASRRALGLGPFENDRPLRAGTVDVVRAAGATVRHTSRWLRAVSAEADSAAIERLARRSDVIRITRVGTLVRADGEPAAVRLDATPDGAAVMPAEQQNDSAFYGPNWRAIRELGIPSAHQFGFTAEGVRIAILDTGFELAHESLQSRRVVAMRDFINDDEQVSDEAGEVAGQESHGTRVWSLLGGFKPGSIVGPAYDASFLLAKVDEEPDDTQADEDRWVAAIEWADSNGARVISSSLAFRSDFADQPAIPYTNLDGDTEVTSRTADEAARRGMLIVTAVGDGGPSAGSLAAPADADSVLAVGAVNENAEPAVFANGATARGPTFDGRIKPEVVARGVGLRAASSASPGGYDAGLAGTSYATSLVAGGAAMLIEAWPSLGPFAVRQALMFAGSQAATPDNASGWGLPDVAAAILFPEGLTPASVATVNLDRVITTVAPSFTWSAPLVHPAMAPVLYRLEVASDPSFAAILYTDTVRDAFSLTVRRALRPAPTVYWRVVAEAQLGVRRVSAAAGPFSMPDWVRLVTPPGDQASDVDGLRPDFVWEPLTAPPPIGPLVYDVEILSHQTGAPVQPPIRNLTRSSVRAPLPLVPNTAYRWRVIARTQLGTADTVESAEPFVVTTSALPPATLLHPNFPNPFPTVNAAQTQVWFDLAEEATVELGVYDQRGRIVRRLIPAEAGCQAVVLEPGLYGRADSGDACVRTSWDGIDEGGRRVVPGIYVLRLRAGREVQYQRILYLGG